MTSDPPSSSPRGAGPRERLERNRRLALAFGIAAPLLQLGRVVLWGYWPPLRQVPIDADGYLAGALLVASARRVARGSPTGPAMLAASWGVWCGVLYRTFTEQLADARRHAGHEALVLAVKGGLLVVAAVGLLGAVRSFERDGLR